ncbi:DUF421 domain-containing protein [Paenibacillus chitinolyticus]|uniref:DUF421 domain-containing protein n=1 Tax=Paenibacillus chitinolyticus TaxID=79263 RepID=UPI003655A0E8
MDFMYIGIKLITGFIGLWGMTRLLGKKEISQLTPFDFVSALMLSELVGNTVYDKEVKYLELLFALALWTVLSLTFEKITQKYKKLRRAFEGSPAVVIEKGKLNVKAMRSNSLDLEQLLMLLREQGIFSLHEVAYGIFENNGSLSILKKSPYDTVVRGDLNLPDEPVELPVPLIEEGEVKFKELERIGRDEEWLKELMKESGFKQIKDIFYAEWHREHGFYASGWGK